MLIVGRAVAGAGAAALFSGGITIVAYSVRCARDRSILSVEFPCSGLLRLSAQSLEAPLPDRKLTSTTIVSAWIQPANVLPQVYPGVGASYINLPIGAIAITAVFFFVKIPRAEHSNLTFEGEIGQIDLVGAFFLIWPLFVSSFPSMGWHHLRIGPTPKFGDAF